MNENTINMFQCLNNKIDKLNERDIEIIKLLKEINKDLKKDNDKYEKVDVCSLCFDDITEEDYCIDNVVDDPTIYGLCHRTCFEEAEESRLA